MDIQRLSDKNLLAEIVGKRKASRLYRGDLFRLVFSGDTSDEYVRELALAREIVKRSLEEDLKERQVLSSPYEVTKYLKIHFGGMEHEVFVAMFLDAQHRLISAEEMFRGTLTGASVYPREVVKRALALNAGAIIFAHNHPSGVAEPSTADRAITRQLSQALELVEVRVLDHFVVARNQVISMAERGMM